MQYLIGQYVLIYGTVRGEIVMPPMNWAASVHDLSYDDYRDEVLLQHRIWVHDHVRGFASCYALHNISPLPGGEL